MSQLEQTSAQYRSLRLSAFGHDLVELVSRADANDLSHLHFAQMLAENGLAERTRRRIERPRLQAGPPLEKPLEDVAHQHPPPLSKQPVKDPDAFGLNPP